MRQGTVRNHPTIIADIPSRSEVSTGWGELSGGPGGHHGHASKGYHGKEEADRNAYRQRRNIRRGSFTAEVENMPNAATPYVSGLATIRALIQGGAPEAGKNEPDRSHMGISSRFMIA